MKVLWITNVLFPEVKKEISGKDDFASSGGWVLGSANAITSVDEMKLCIATPSALVKEPLFFDGNRIRYYVFPLGKGNLKRNRDYEVYMKEIKDSFKPDVVHIHGTEFSQGLAYVDGCGSAHVVVSIQGLTSVIANYYLAGIPTRTIMRNMTIRDLFVRGIFSGKKVFEKRGIFEVELLKKVHSVIGRTSWDRSHVWSINPAANYYFCNESLRKEFYNGRWSYNTCCKHSIFISQATYPIKGFHMFLKAISLVVQNYPDLRVRMAAGPMLDSKSMLQKVRESGYYKYIRRLVGSLNLKDHIVLLGWLTAEQMKEEYLKANVFVIPSAIENSPNSLCEAQILGVPCIASYVGGVADLVPDNQCGELYRYEETEMLAMKICEMFEKSISFDNTHMCEVARKRHDWNKNAKRLISIYNEIISTN